MVSVVCDNIAQSVRLFGLNSQNIGISWTSFSLHQRSTLCVVLHALEAHARRVSKQPSKQRPSVCRRHKRVVKHVCRSCRDQRRVRLYIQQCHCLRAACNSADNKHGCSLVLLYCAAWSSQSCQT